MVSFFSLRETGVEKCNMAGSGRPSSSTTEMNTVRIEGPDCYQDELNKLVQLSEKCLNRLGGYAEKCLTHQEKYSSGHFMQEVPPLTPLSSSLETSLISPFIQSGVLCP
ncbi:hypothetical protein TNCV_5044281 [Trichonephila clavipes]|uniref:Uncharacterized protein n=1 Tax=Trichonephila clavipes TaxID=2585209 RepID=A0A8X6WHD2_TRICX|nr:hypothetical protein TNCV_5044281 [Trichonephila clavipes]